ncbi:hydrogenase maturation protease [Saccharomonospora sp. NB11]|jgi:hydrogenase maturation protease|uniref:hydrogenase maturation protease n=1 Tax=Saccharomonospora sp. NB11 TaxID=1642298 RepID=UPI001E2F2D4D|nr:hydrogenase maturation protease [Saccharomonospora sp. NB11]
MRPRVLVTGVGTLLRGDEGFALEVVQRLAEQRLPAWVQLADHGIGRSRLQHDMLGDYDTTVLVDGTPHGGAPGRLWVADLDLLAPEAETNVLGPRPHRLTPAAELTLLRLLGGDASRLVVVGCEPRTTTGVGLSTDVHAAVDDAVTLITELVWGAPATVDSGGSTTARPG